MHGLPAPPNFLGFMYKPPAFRPILHRQPKKICMLNKHELLLALHKLQISAKEFYISQLPRQAKHLRKEAH